MRDGRWISVPPIEGTVVMFLAETMQIWTVDKYTAAVRFNMYMYITYDFLLLM